MAPSTSQDFFKPACNSLDIFKLFISLDFFNCLYLILFSHINSLLTYYKPPYKFDTNS